MPRLRTARAEALMDAAGAKLDPLAACEAIMTEEKKAYQRQFSTASTID
jgi:hypothetical protein